MLEAAIIDCLPPATEGWIDIPQLRRRLRGAGIEIGPGALGDELRQMHQSGAVRLGAWQRSAREIPQPDHALLGPESVVLYYVSRGF